MQSPPPPAPVPTPVFNRPAPVVLRPAPAPYVRPSLPVAPVVAFRAPARSGGDARAASAAVAVRSALKPAPSRAVQSYSAPPIQSQVRSSPAQLRSSPAQSYAARSSPAQSFAAPPRSHVAQRVSSRDTGVGSRGRSEAQVQQRSNFAPAARSSQQRGGGSVSVNSAAARGGAFAGSSPASVSLSSKEGGRVPIGSQSLGRGRP